MLCNFSDFILNFLLFIGIKQTLCLESIKLINNVLGLKEFYLFTKFLIEEI